MNLSEFLVSFIECAVHTIIYARGIYPRELFEQRKFLGINVWQSRHPDINSYIRRVINNSQSLVAKVVSSNMLVVPNTCILN